ncbi:TetR/AcrR family transcriptional regulator [Curtobacterium ammoniigenes]|uniref:TetR/AcrR family transcriptional regulator n=1 Tax=Curtobacterium ammoniigenes TaxID=395387 RepID=UPI000A841079|nr:hypothetical protein [Curtobacterium ammoniigenes]
MSAELAVPHSDLRQRITAAAIETYRDADFPSVGVDDVARTAGLHADVIRSVFPSWELLVVSVADQWSGSLRRTCMHIGESDGAAAYLRALLTAADGDRAMIRMRIALLSAGSDPTHAAAGWFRSEYDRFLEDIVLMLTRDVLAKREPRTMTPKHGAEQLIALYEGLQMQAIMLPGVEILPSWDRAVTRMRSGWATAYRPLDR